MAGAGKKEHYGRFQLPCSQPLQFTDSHGQPQEGACRVYEGCVAQPQQERCPQLASRCRAAPAPALAACSCSCPAAQPVASPAARPPAHRRLFCCRPGAWLQANIGSNVNVMASGEAYDAATGAPAAVEPRLSLLQPASGQRSRPRCRQTAAVAPRPCRSAAPTLQGRGNATKAKEANPGGTPPTRCWPMLDRGL